MRSVDGTFIAMIQHCGQDLLTAIKAKSMDLEKKMENMFTQVLIK